VGAWAVAHLSALACSGLKRPHYIADCALARAARKEADTMSTEINRREFLTGAAAAAATFTIVPRRVLGGAGFVAPSDKITLACIGFGTQAIREIGGILASPDVQWWRCATSTGTASYLSGARTRSAPSGESRQPAWREGSGVPGGRVGMRSSSVLRRGAAGAEQAAPRA
jgi:hypothetical protein